MTRGATLPPHPVEVAAPARPLVSQREGGHTLADFLTADNPYHRWLMLVNACREIHERAP